MITSGVRHLFTWVKDRLPSRGEFPLPLRWILIAGLVHALIYVFLVPPWQHYDEPSHFEFAWLLANHPEYSKPWEHDLAFRNRIAQSMLDHHFREFQKSPIPVFVSPTETVIGVPQVSWQTLYYLVIGLPMRILTTHGLLLQFYLARMISVILFLLTLFFAYRFLEECTASSNPLRWMVPLGMVLFPSFVDIMTSINNDVLATCLFTAFLWVVMRMLLKGITIRNLLVGVLLVVACVLTKSTVYISIPIFFLAILFSTLRRENIRHAWIFLAVCLSAFVIVGWDGGDAAFWIRNSIQSEPDIASTEKAPFGSSAFFIQLGPDEPDGVVTQVVPVEITRALNKKPFTVGAWIWCSRPMTQNFLSVNTGVRVFSRKIDCTTETKFFAMQIPAGAIKRQIIVQLKPMLGNQPNVDVYYDGLILAEGMYPINKTPAFSSSSLSVGIWDTNIFENEIRNPSAEIAGFRFAPWLDQFGGWIYNYKPSTIAQATMDLESTGLFQWRTMNILARTCWGLFGWANVRLLGAPGIYTVLLAWSALLVLGAIVFGFRNKRTIPWDTILVIGFALGGVWMITYFREIGSIASPRVAYAVSRYADPIFLLTMLVMCMGVLTIIRSLRRWIPLKGHIWTIAIIGCCLLFDVYAVISQIVYYIQNV